jgi:phosphoglycerol transferase MdoB-like AlkP superfamily enzyme
MKNVGLPRVIKWTLSTGFVFLVLITLMRICLFLFFNRQSHSLQQASSSFLLGLRFDLRVVCVLMLFMMVMGSIRLFSPFYSQGARLGWRIFFGVAIYLLVLFYFVDFAHFAYLGQRLNASVLNYLQDAGISMKMVWQSYPVIRLLILLIVFTFLIMWVLKVLLRSIDKNQQQSSTPKKVAWFVVFFVLFGLAIFGRINQYPLRWSDAFQLGDDYKAQLALNPFESFFNTLKYRHSSYDIKKVKKYFPLISFYLNIPSSANDSIQFRRVIQPKESLPVKPNVVLVICESFSGYKSSMYGNPLNTTPYFNQLCNKGIFFERCFTPTYGTARGVWAVVTGIPDVEVANTASRNPAAVDQHTIINDYKDYQKFYFIGGSASWANIRGVLTNNISGLHLYEEEDFKAARVDVWGISDKNLMLEANKILAKQTSPFFAVIQTADNHRPYTIPKEDEKTFKLANFPIDTVKKYGFESLEEMNAFRYTDFSFEQFIEAAKKQPYFRNTIFVFVGDHGIVGNAGNMFPAAWTTKRLVSEHVPLLFYAPYLLKPARFHMPVSQVDVLPTAAGLCKIPYVNSTLGRDVLDSSFNNKHFAFIFDPDSRMVGVVNDSFFYRESFLTSQAEIAPVRNNIDSATNTTTQQMQQLTEAMFESAKYLLLNNKKK